MSAWVLFIFAWWTLLHSTRGYLNSGSISRTPAFDFVGLWALAAACFMLGFVAMKVRQMLE